MSGDRHGLTIALAASCAASAWIAPLRGTPAALLGDAGFTLLALGLLGSLVSRSRAVATMRWLLVTAAAILLGAMPWVGWGQRPMIALWWSLAPVGVIAGGLLSDSVTRPVRASRRMAAWVALALVAVAGWAAIELMRAAELRRGAISVSIQVMRQTANQLRDGHVLKDRPRDGWGWLIRIEQAGGDFRIVAPGAGGRFEDPREAGPVASWEDDFVVTRDQDWLRWPAGTNDGFSAPEPWRDWRTGRWSGR